MYFIKKYPFSLSLLAVILYLSFFRPPSTGLELFKNFDKFVHFCMYCSASSVLWIEFFLNHRRSKSLPLLKGLIGAAFCPALFSGLVELGQNYLTDYRGGEWLDFASNVCGIVFGSLIAWFIIRKWIVRN